MGDLLIIGLWLMRLLMRWNVVWGLRRERLLWTWIRMEMGVIGREQSLDAMMDDSKEDQMDVSPVSPWRPMRTRMTMLMTRWILVPMVRKALRLILLWLTSSPCLTSFTRFYTRRIQAVALRVLMDRMRLQRGCIGVVAMKGWSLMLTAKVKEKRETTRTKRRKKRKRRRRRKRRMMKEYQLSSGQRLTRRMLWILELSSSKETNGWRILSLGEELATIWEWWLRRILLIW